MALLVRPPSCPASLRCRLDGVLFGAASPRAAPRRTWTKKAAYGGSEWDCKSGWRWQPYLWRYWRSRPGKPRNWIEPQSRRGEKIETSWRGS